MAGSFNKVIAMGNLTRDIEIRHTQAGTPVGNFGIAMNRRFKTQSGEQRESVTFIDCTFWGRGAEVMAQYVSKGDPILLEGRLDNEEWEDRQSGQMRSKVILTVESFQFVSSSGNGGGARDTGRGGAGVDHDDVPW